MPASHCGRSLRGKRAPKAQLAEHGSEVRTQYGWYPNTNLGIVLA